MYIKSWEANLIWLYVCVLYQLLYIKLNSNFHKFLKIHSLYKTLVYEARYRFIKMYNFYFKHFSIYRILNENQVETFSNFIWYDTRSVTSSATPDLYL
jgi:hypothetical protein